MYQKEVLGLEEIRAGVEAALKEGGKQPDRPLSIAVVDEQGDLVFFARMDGTPPLSARLAVNMARTAALTLKNTSTLAEQDREWGREISIYGDAGFTYITGGATIRQEEEDRIIYGAVGVIGRKADQDEVVAKLAIRTMGLSSD